MDNQSSKELCFTIQRCVGSRTAEEFYDSFNLINCNYVEFSFNEMQVIFNLPGMEDWRSVFDKSDKNAGDVTIALVSFKPPCDKEEPSQVTAFDKVEKMFTECFLASDHEHIKAAMNTCPTMAIFLSRTKKSLKKRKRTSKNPSIFEAGNTNQVHCLCAVNYFRHEQHTVVLWLATTVKKPFDSSIHTIWRNKGLATYLLCMLIKQHTGAGRDMKKSILCLQASHENNRDACRFYKRHGFRECIVWDDNGLSFTSEEFQKIVKKTPQCWVFPKEHNMDFYDLHCGRLIVPTPSIDLTLDAITEEISKDVYLRFPWPASSMKRIEDCVINKPILSTLSGPALPYTDRPYPYQKGSTRLLSSITASFWKRATDGNERHWLCTDEIVFLSALLLRNTSENKFVHVLSPDWTLRMTNLFSVTEQMNVSQPDPAVTKKYNLCIEECCKYVDSVRDLFEHKFLVFLCNPTHAHWISYVVVNPLLVYQKGKPGSTSQADESDAFAGWCLFDSLSTTKTSTGLIDTTSCESHPYHGIHYFLNVCASYLYSQEQSVQIGSTQHKFDYQEPFGGWSSSEPSKEFPRFDYNDPSILGQRDTFNCGFACVANAFAFVKHLKDVSLETSTMTRVDDGHYLLSSENYSLTPFWEEALRNLSLVHGANYQCNDLLIEFRKEHYLVVNELNKVYMADMHTKQGNAKERQQKAISLHVDQCKDIIQAGAKEQTDRQDRIEYIVRTLKEMGDETDAWVNLDCNNCHTSFERYHPFRLPTRKDTMKWSLLWETPTSVKKRKDLQRLLGVYYKLLKSENFSDIVTWSEYDVQTCMVLLCHAYHCPGVQCFYIQGMEYWSSEDRKELRHRSEENETGQVDGKDNEGNSLQPIVWGGTIPAEQLRTLPKSISTLLLICHRENHFGVMKVIAKDHVVQVWDAAAQDKAEVENFWKLHAIRAIKVHFPEQVREDELNILTSTEKTTIKESNDGNQIWQQIKENLLCTWVVEGMWSPKCYYQKDIHSCGPIALNRFATELHKICEQLKEGQSRIKEVHPSIICRIKSPEELKEKNSQNAAELYQALLATASKAFGKKDDGKLGNQESQFVMEKPAVVVLDDDESAETKRSAKTLDQKKKPNKKRESNEEKATNQHGEKAQDLSPADLLLSLQKPTDGKPKAKLQTLEERIATENEENAEGENIGGATQNEDTVEENVSSGDILEKKRTLRRRLPYRGPKPSENPGMKTLVRERKERERQKKRQHNSCRAGTRCRLPLVHIVLEGGRKNASECSSCKRLYHDACLFQWGKAEGIKNFCICCYKKTVITEYDPGCLFTNIFEERTKVPKGKPTPVLQDLEDYLNDYLKSAGFAMSCSEFKMWKENEKSATDRNPEHKRRALVEEHERKHSSEYLRTCHSYEKAIKLGTEDWKLSNDGIVTALRYNPQKHQFIARLKYPKNGTDMEEDMYVDSDWVVDEYGHEVMAKLIDRGSNKEFVLAFPNTKKGKLAIIHLDDKQTVKRVKYNNGQWLGMLDNEKVVNLEEGFMKENFRKRFLQECQNLGPREFVPIPTGTSRCSLMKQFPTMKCEGAPSMKYMQGNVDSCVFSSLASAFHCTGIPSLMQAGNILVMRSKKFSGGSKSMTKAKKVVQDHVRWLESKKLKNDFDWESDLTNYMFVVGVMKDSHNSQQHAVTIFREWIFDSNEPYALPLNKNNLDICTWDVKPGNVIEKSVFVNFCGGWIFHERDEKKRKILDHSKI
jgi:hypothetical protein